MLPAVSAAPLFHLSGCTRVGRVQEALPGTSASGQPKASIGRAGLGAMGWSLVLLSHLLNCCLGLSPEGPCPSWPWVMSFPCCPRK